jgi:hypothetical protein
MDRATVWRLLERGGALDAATCEMAGADCARRIETFNPLLDPVATEQLGNALEERLAEGRFDLVAVWDSVENAVLGYVVGRALERPIVRFFDAEGLIQASAEIPAGARAVFVAPAILDPQEPRLTRALLEARGATLDGVAVIVDTAEHGDPSVALATLEPYVGERCPICQRGQSLANARGPLAPGGLRG